jgi:hypothetical protein
MTHKEKRIFFNWLQKHNALEGYRRNRHVFMQTLSERRGFISISSYLNLPVPAAICSAFDWGETPEGGQYWSKLDDKWVYEYYKLI